MPVLGMRTVGDLSEEELAQIGRQTIERLLRGPQGIPTAAQRNFAMQVYQQIAPQLTPEYRTSLGEFLRPYFEGPPGSRPTYATLRQARPLFESQFEGAGRDVSGVSPWLLSYAQPLQDRSGLAAGPALAERAWEQYLQGVVGGMVRDPVTGQLVPTNEMQLALGLSWLASAAEANQGQPLTSVLETIFGWPSGAGTSAGQGQTSGATAEDLSSSAKAVLAPETGEGKIIRSASDAAAGASAQAQGIRPNWQVPSLWQQIAAYFTPGGTDRLAPSPEVVQALQEHFATPQEAFEAVNEALRQAERDSNTPPNLLQALRALQVYLAQKAITGNFWDWRSHVPFVQPGW